MNIDQVRLHLIENDDLSTDTLGGYLDKALNELETALAEKEVLAAKVVKLTSLNYEKEMLLEDAISIDQVGDLLRAVTRRRK
jgi:hypothetical protein